MGPKGSFSDIAAKYLGKGFQKKYCGSLGAVFEAAECGELVFAPVQNKIVGEIKPAAKRLASGGYKIIKTIRAPVEFVLAGRKRLALGDVAKIYCAKIASLQCGKFIKKYLRNAKVSFVKGSTAVAFKKVVQQKGFSSAGIGSLLAARARGLVILARGIQDDKNNWTEFALICVFCAGRNKARLLRR